MFSTVISKISKNLRLCRVCLRNLSKCLGTRNKLQNLYGPRIKAQMIEEHMVSKYSKFMKFFQHENTFWCFLIHVKRFPLLLKISKPCALWSFALWSGHQLQHSVGRSLHCLQTAHDLTADDLNRQYASHYLCVRQEYR